jgi:hypothetical protein
MAEKMILDGAWTQVRVETEAGIHNLGLALGVSFDEDFRVSGASVLNHLGDVTLDSHGYQCSITMQMFYPNRKIPDTSLFRDGGEITVHDLMATRDAIQSAGQGKKFVRMMFVNTETQEIVEQFQDVIVASQGAQINPNDYARANMRLMAIKRL